MLIVPEAIRLTVKVAYLTSVASSVEISISTTWGICWIGNLKRYDEYSRDLGCVWEC